MSARGLPYDFLRAVLARCAICVMAVLPAWLAAGCAGATGPMTRAGFELEQPPPASLRSAAPPAQQTEGDRPITDGSGSSGEVSVAADPQDPRVAVAAYLEFGNPHVSVSRTTDRGATWREVKSFPSGDGEKWTADPSLAFDRDGRLYLSYLKSASYDTQTGGGLYVSHSDDAGATWSEPVLAVRSLDQGVCSGPDKEMIGTGPPAGAAGRDVVYLSWQDHTTSSPATCNGDGPTVVTMSRSTDGGRTWSDPRPLSEPFEHGFGSMPRALADGTLLIPYIRAGGTASCRAKLEIVVARSTDQGQSFETGPVVESCFAAFTAGGMAAVANSIPILSTYGNQAAMVWVTEEGTDDNRVDLLVSDDSGRTWKPGPPAAVGLPIALQPWLAHGPDGRLHLLFYGATPGGLYDVFLTTLEGSQWTHPRQLNSQPSLGHTVGLGFGIGHYPGLDVGPDGLAYGMWSDARSRPASHSFYLWGAMLPVGGTRPSRPAGTPGSPSRPGGEGRARGPRGPRPLVLVPRTVKRSALRRGLRVVLDGRGERLRFALRLRSGRRVLAQKSVTAVRTQLRLRLRRAPRRGERLTLMVTAVTGDGRRVTLRRGVSVR